jgi:hypothetical protein
MHSLMRTSCRPFVVAFDCKASPDEWGATFVRSTSFASRLKPQVPDPLKLPLIVGATFPHIAEH